MVRNVENVEEVSLGREEVAVAGENKECFLVGSKNSDKYHFPECSHAKRIKASNLVCFSSVEEAEKKGYKPSSCIH